MTHWEDIPTKPGFYSAQNLSVENGFQPYQLMHDGIVRVTYTDGTRQDMENFETIEVLGPFRRLTSSRYNPILNSVRKAMAESDYTLEALAYEGRWGCTDVLIFGFTVDDVWGFEGTRDDARQALNVFRRILRIEQANL